MCKIVNLTITQDGNVSFCQSCNKYYLEFGNIQMKISKEELVQMKKTLDGIDMDYWFSVAETTGVSSQSIYIDIRPTTVRLRFKKQEFLRLLRLLDTTLFIVEGCRALVEIPHNCN